MVVSPSRAVGELQHESCPVCHECSYLQTRYIGRPRFPFRDGGVDVNLRLGPLELVSRICSMQTGVSADACDLRGCLSLMQAIHRSMSETCDSQ